MSSSDENSLIIWSFDIWVGNKNGFEIMKVLKVDDRALSPLWEEVKEATLDLMDYNYWAIMCKVWLV